MIAGDSRKTDIQIQEEILKELKLKGVASQMEDESVSPKAKKAGDEEFKILSGYVNHKIQQIGRKIFQGEISAEPYQLGDSTGCDYCPYHGICGFDAGRSGQDYRKLEHIKDDGEILRKMQEVL